jgi:putative FmdB family regulatory protein
MPTYEYICKTCGKSFERHLHFSDDIDHVTCPLGHVNTKRVFARPSIVFKGSGFYTTDSRKASKVNNSK